MTKMTIKALEVNEKDNLSTAFGKGMLSGVIKSGAVWAGIGALFVVAGKTQQLMTNKQENEAE